MSSEQNDIIKVYLDQKDYSSIARGLNGESGYEQFTEIYDYLFDHVESGKLAIYFSSFHIIESLRYAGLESELWGLHCDIVDKLTKGNCLLYFKEIEKRELEIFLSDQYNVQTSLIKANYPYGKYKDAVPPGNIKQLVLRKNIIKQLKTKSLSTGLPRKTRRKLIRQAPKNLLTKSHVRAMEQRDFDKIHQQSVNKQNNNNFNNDLHEFLDKENYVNFLCGSHVERQKIISNFFDNVFHFKNLVHRYGSLFQEFETIAKFPEQLFGKLQPIIKKLQEGQKIFGKSIVKYDELKEELKQSFVNDLKPSINKSAAKHKFSSKVAEKQLLDTDLTAMPIINSLLLFTINYLKVHDAQQKARNPIVSDTSDLQHLRYIPYVDCFLTDGFSCNLSKNIAAKAYKTRVFNGLFELKKYLESSLVK